MTDQVIRINTQFTQNIEEMSTHLEDIAGNVEAFKQIERRKADALERISTTLFCMMWVGIIATTVNIWL